MKVALFQTELEWQDAKANRARFEEAMESCPEGAKIIVFPEMFNTGFTMEVKKVAETMDGPTVAWLKWLSIQSSAAICASLVIEESGKYFNRFIWALNGEVRCTYDKRHLFRMADEHHHFSPGNFRPVIDHEGWKIMPRICYDLRFPVWSRSTDIDLQIYVANWPAARVQAWDKLLMSRAIENQCYVVGLNRIGKDGKGIFYSGHSIVINPRGEAMTPEKWENPGWIEAELDLKELNAFREKFPLAMDADKFTVH